MANRLVEGLRNLLGFKNLYNEAIYKTMGGAYVAYDKTNSVLMEKGYGENPDVYAIVNQMATKSMSVPFEVKKKVDKKAYSKLQKLKQSTKASYTPHQLIIKSQLEKKAFEQEDEDDLPMPLERPNPTQTWHDVIALYKTFIKVTGNCYFYILAPEEGANAGKPLQLYVLPADQMQLVLKKDVKMLTIENPIDYYMLINGNSYVHFDPKNIIHIKRPNPFYDYNGTHLYGWSELRAAIRNIQSSNLTIDNNNKMMANSGVYGFIHAKDGQTPLTHEQAESLKQRLVEMDSNSGRLSHIAGASAAIGFTSLSLTTDQLKPFEYLAFDRKSICNVLNWPDELLNNDGVSTLGGTDQLIEARKRAITDNILPDLELLAETLNKEFLPRFKGYENACLEFDVSELPEMQTDMEKMVNWLSKAPITPNEMRDALKYEPFMADGMDSIWIDNNKAKIDGEILTDEQFNVAMGND